MPELDGLGVVDAVGAARMPLTVFVTAYDQHAVRAFEANALDYLLKPFSDERHDATMARVRARLAERDLRGFGQRLLDLATARTAASPVRFWDRLVVKAGGTTRFVRAGRNRLDRGRRRLRHAPRRPLVVPLPLRPVRAGRQARSAPVHPRPPVRDRQPRERRPARTALARRVRGRPQERRPPAHQPHLPRPARSPPRPVAVAPQ